MGIKLNLFPNIKQNEETFECKYKRPYDQEWVVFSDRTEVILHKDDAKVQLKVKKKGKVEVDSFLEVRPIKNTEDTFSLQIKYNGSSKIWEFKLKEPKDTDPSREDPTVNVTMGKDKEC